MQAGDGGGVGGREIEPAFPFLGGAAFWRCSAGRQQQQWVTVLLVGDWCCAGGQASRFSSARCVPYW